jgi:hypothetical protein
VNNPVSSSSLRLIHIADIIYAELKKIASNSQIMMSAAFEFQMRGVFFACCKLLRFIKKT